MVLQNPSNSSPEDDNDLDTIYANDFASMSSPVEAVTMNTEFIPQELAVNLLAYHFQASFFEAIHGVLPWDLILELWCLTAVTTSNN